MKTFASRTVPLNESTMWQADKRLLPSYLCAGDNTNRIRQYKKALKNAIDTRLTPLQREHIFLYYKEQLTKTQIGERYGVGSSTVCKTIKAAEKILREYIELYMQIYDLMVYENMNNNEECDELQRG